MADNFLGLNKIRGPAAMAISKGFDRDSQPLVGLVMPLPNSVSASDESDGASRSPCSSYET